MKLLIALLFISMSGLAQVKVTPKQKHDTSYVLELDPVIWQKINYVVSKSNAEHLVWSEVNEYLNATDPKKNHVKVVVDSVVKK